MLSAKRLFVATAVALLVAAALAAGLAWHRYRANTPQDYTLADAPLAAPLAVNAPPRFALVLGSGGHRGHAHIGVLKVLEAEAIRPDLVVGASVGALVGALYAAGIGARDIERRALELDHEDLKEFTLSRYGFLSGEGMQRFVNDTVAGRPIEALDIPFAAVATEIPSGAPVAFTRGNTGLAVRASAAIPGVFLPVKSRGRLYADGDVARPLPARTARSLGASIVVAVDVSADPAGAPFEEIPPEWVKEGIMRRVMIEAEAGAADLILRPKLPYYAPRTREYKLLAIAKGEEAAREALPRLRALLATSSR